MFVLSNLQSSTIDDAIISALLNNPEIKVVKESNKKYIQMLNQAKAKNKPKIDFEFVGESKRIKRDATSNFEPKIQSNGYNAKILLEQLLYDGGLTTAKISEMRYKEQSNKFSNNERVSKIILKSINAYLNLVQYTYRIKLINENILKHKNYLNIARNNENITGNIIETYEVLAKLNTAKKIKLDELEGYEIARSKYSLITNLQDYNVSLPIINQIETDQLIEEASLKNYELLAKKQEILQQKEIFKQSSSHYLPTIKLNLSASQDKNLMIDDVVQNTYSAQVIFKYNIYRGGEDEATSLKEKIALLEMKEDFNLLKISIIDKMSSDIMKYKYSLKKIIELKKMMKIHSKILNIYKLEFQGGTKRFIDILNEENIYYNTKKTLMNEKIRLRQSYYALLVNTTKLSTKYIETY